MERTKLLLAVICTSISVAIHAQTESKKDKKTTTQQEGNVMDMAAKTIGFAFGDLEKDIDGTKDPFKDIDNFEDYLNKSNLDPKTKATYWAIYKLQAEEPSPQRRDSIRNMLDSLIRKDRKAKNTINKKQNR
ncbi:MAG: hypothetical protein AAFQ20_03585 [Bacteroidota bacterium]